MPRGGERRSRRRSRSSRGRGSAGGLSEWSRRDLTFDSGGVECAAWLCPPAPDDGDPGAATARPASSWARLRVDPRGGRPRTPSGSPSRAGRARVRLPALRRLRREPRQLLDIRRQHDDWRAALAFARSLPEVDAGQIVAWGYSLGGGHVMTIAAERDDLAGAITMNPFADGLRALRPPGRPTSRS